MINEEEIEKLAKPIKTMASNFASLEEVDARNVFLRPELNVIGFQDAGFALKQLAKVAAQVLECDLQLMLNNTLMSEFYKSSDTVFKTLSQMRDFDIAEITKLQPPPPQQPGKPAPAAPQKQNPVEVRDAILTRLTQNLEDYCKKAFPIVGLCRRVLIDTKDIEVATEKAGKSLEGIEAQLAKLMERSRESEDILAAMKTASKQTGLTAYANYFELEAIDHKMMARLWLVATALAAISTASVVAFFYREWEKLLPTLAQGQLLPTAIMRLVVVSFCLSVLVWMARNYKAHRHNYVVNRHRVNALSSFEAFAKATNDDQMKDRVLMQATQAIFSAQSSGYIEGGGEVVPQMQMMEIIKSAVTTKK